MQRARAALRIGEGWDTHALVAGRPLVLGGVDDPAQPRPAGPLGRRRAAARDHRRAARRGGAGRHRPALSRHRRGVPRRRLDRAAGRGGAARARGRLRDRQRRQHHRRAGAEDGAAHPGDARSASPQALGAGDRIRSTSRPRRPRRWGRWARASAIEARAVCLLCAL